MTAVLFGRVMADLEHLKKVYPGLSREQGGDAIHNEEDRKEYAKLNGLRRAVGSINRFYERCQILQWKRTPNKMITARSEMLQTAGVAQDKEAYSLDDVKDIQKLLEPAYRIFLIEWVAELFSLLELKRKFTERR